MACVSLHALKISNIVFLLNVIIVLCTSGIEGFVYQRAEGELINRIFNATSA